MQGNWNPALIVNSLLAVFLVMALGHAAKRWIIDDDHVWNGLEKLTYFILFPALITKTLMDADLTKVPFFSIAAALLGANLLLCFSLIASQSLLERRFSISGPSFTSVFQGALRWNSFIALAIAGNLFGKEGVTLASVAVAALIPVLNVESIWVLRRYGAGKSGSFWRGLTTNPFMVSVALGIFFNLTGLHPPRALGMVLDILGQCSLGVGLLLVGAGLHLQDVSRPGFPLVLTTVLRLLILPLLGATFAYAMGLSPVAITIVVICLGVPSAPASYVLAKLMGGDAPLMAAILTAQTLVSIISLSALLLIFSP